MTQDVEDYPWEKGLLYIDILTASSVEINLLLISLVIK